MLPRKTKKGSSVFKVHSRQSRSLGGGGCMGGGGVKSVQTQDLEAEQNDIARHAGRLEVKNAAAKLNE